ncbi:MAG: phospholipase D-like domain-containing protein [Verrucomicrobiota bacterium]
MIITDFTTSEPTVIVGSHNFSKNASDKNDENVVVIKGDTDVADTYFCEMLRLYDHYRFRFNAKKKSGQGTVKPLTLSPDNSWTDSYFDPDNLKFEERLRFSAP